MEDWDVSLVQDIPFTTFVQKTLVNYALGIGVVQEWLANADDAKASKFKILLDFNSYSTEGLLCETMKSWQGPAIWIYNSGAFSSNDWEGFTKKVGRSFKKMDADTIGTFGLGALTMYHFTDLISVVSGDQVLFLDVSKSYLPINKAKNERNSSMKGNFIEKKLLERFPGQFQSYARFKSLFGSSMEEKLNGTLFRLPLRTEETAKRSYIKNKIGLGDANDLFQQAIQKIDQMLLFLQNVESIEIYQCLQNKEPELLCQASISNISEIREKRKLNLLPEKLVNGVEATSFQMNISLTKKSDTSNSTWRIYVGRGESSKKEEEEIDFETRAIKFQAGVAVPMKDNGVDECEGKAFCYLPILTDAKLGLPLNINGSFIYQKTDKAYG